MLHRAVPGVTPDGFVPGAAMDRGSAPEASARFAPGSYSASARTVEAVFSAGSRVRRWGIYEELSLDAGAVDLARVGQGQVRLLNSHNQYDIGAILGTVEEARIDNGQLVGRIRFADTEAGREAETMVASGDARGLSVGYRVTSWRLSQVENDIEIWRAEAWELLEVSLVAVPADPAAMVRSAGMAETSTPEMETDDMRRNVPTGAAPAPVTTPAPEGQRAAPPAPAAPAAEQIRAEERARVTAITDIARRAALTDAVRDEAIAGGTTVEAFRAAAFEAMAGRQTPASSVRIQQDETETLRTAMQEALVRGMNASAMPGEWSEVANAYRGLSLVGMAAARLGIGRVPENFAEREDVLRRAMHTTSDFPIILENAMNRSVAARYALAQPTYRAVARREDFADFRPHISVSAGDLPTLSAVGEGGRIEFGTIGEKKEQVAVGSYARAVRLSRQLLVNDTLGALEAALADYGQVVALLEETTAYGVVLANSGDGPALLEGAANMFTTGRTNKAGTATAINEAGVSAGRAAMRKYKGISPDGGTTAGPVLLYNAPSILLCGPDKETEAEKFVATVVAAQTGNVNPFSGKLRVVVSPMITGNAWWLFTDPSVRSNFRWGLLNGFTAPRVRTDEPFGQQGLGISVEHDFGFGGIDWRAGYRNAGA